MSEPLKPTRWHLGMTIGRVESGEYLVCPECGEYAVPASPIDWTPAWGPRPGWSHVLDGQPLCPVINTGDGVSGYVPALPVTRTEYDDANGCPCQATYTCVCACTSCSCRSEAQLWRRLEDAIDGDEGVISHG
jgi:hypothetical protein